MKYVVELRPLASSDALSAFFYYDDISEELGFRFQKDLEVSIRKIQGNPYLFQKRYKDARVAFLETFPFGIHYVIRRNVIYVVAVLSTKGNPAYWETRS